jgi:Zn-dependent protease/predicted transcriptional regulator
LNGNIPLLRVLGIPIQVNISWFITLAFVTSILALQIYPEIIPPGSRYRDDEAVHWGMAIASGLVFFGSIVVHELAHSVVARKQGIPVRGITLFIFGGVAQITAEAKRPLHEFLMAVVGPLTSMALGALFFGAWWLLGSAEDQPVPLVLEGLFFMNVIVGIFNLAPGFPMDGGRVVRALLWGVSGNFYGATRWATVLGRALGYGLMALGTLALLRTLSFVDPWSGVWFLVLGIFLEGSARQSWVQAQALDTLGKYRAEDVMSRDLETVDRSASLAMVRDRGGRRRRFMLLVANEDDQILGVVTEKELLSVPPERRGQSTAEDAMLGAEQALTVAPTEDAAKLLQTMEAEELWHLPVVLDSRVIGIVSKESLLRIIAARVINRPRFAGQP